MKPANFLDIGGGASATIMAAGLDVILGDEQVKSVFVNVFGGITSCVAVADGIVKALEILGDAAPSASSPRDPSPDELAAMLQRFQLRGGNVNALLADANVAPMET